MSMILFDFQSFKPKPIINDGFNDFGQFSMIMFPYDRLVMIDCRIAELCQDSMTLPLGLA